MDIFRSDHFNQHFTSHLHLLLQLDEHRFSYCVYDPQNKQIQLLHTKALVLQPGKTAGLGNLTDALVKDDMLHLPYRKKCIAWIKPTFLLVPDEILEAGMETKYAMWSQHLPEGNQLITTTCHPYAFLFSLPEVHLNSMENLFPNAHLQHAAAALLRYSETWGDGEHIFVDVREEWILVAVARNGKLLLVNHYDYHSKDDFLYFLMLPCDQLGIDREKATLHVSGFITKDSELAMEMDKFFSQIHYPPASELSLPLDGPTPMAGYSFTTLLAMSLCE
jgi:hypothetical protein